MFQGVWTWTQVALNPMTVITIPEEVVNRKGYASVLANAYNTICKNFAIFYDFQILMLWNDVPFELKGKTYTWQDFGYSGEYYLDCLTKFEDDEAAWLLYVHTTETGGLRVSWESTRKYLGDLKNFLNTMYGSLTKTDTNWTCPHDRENRIKIWNDFMIKVKKFLIARKKLIDQYVKDDAFLVKNEHTKIEHYVEKNDYSKYGIKSKSPTASINTKYVYQNDKSIQVTNADKLSGILVPRFNKLLESYGAMLDILDEWIKESDYDPTQSERISSSIDNFIQSIEVFMLEYARLCDLILDNLNDLVNGFFVELMGYYEFIVQGFKESMIGIDQNIKNSSIYRRRYFTLRKKYFAQGRLLQLVGFTKHLKDHFTADLSTYDKYQQYYAEEIQKTYIVSVDNATKYKAKQDKENLFKSIKEMPTRTLENDVKAKISQLKADTATQLERVKQMNTDELEANAMYATTLPLTTLTDENGKVHIVIDTRDKKEIDYEKSNNRLWDEEQHRYLNEYRIQEAAKIENSALFVKYQLYNNELTNLEKLLSDNNDFVIITNDISITDPHNNVGIFICNTYNQNVLMFRNVIDILSEMCLHIYNEAYVNVTEVVHILEYIIDFVHTLATVGNDIKNRIDSAIKRRLVFDIKKIVLDNDLANFNSITSKLNSEITALRNSYKVTNDEGNSMDQNVNMGLEDRVIITNLLFTYQKDLSSMLQHFFTSIRECKDYYIQFYFLDNVDNNEQILTLEEYLIAIKKISELLQTAPSDDNTTDSHKRILAPLQVIQEKNKRIRTEVENLSKDINETLAEQNERKKTFKTSRLQTERKRLKNIAIDQEVSKIEETDIDALLEAQNETKRIQQETEKKEQEEKEKKLADEEKRKTEELLNIQKLEKDKEQELLEKSIALEKAKKISEQKEAADQLQKDKDKLQRQLLETRKKEKELSDSFNQQKNEEVNRVNPNDDKMEIDQDSRISPEVAQNLKKLREQELPPLPISTSTPSNVTSTIKQLSKKTSKNPTSSTSLQTPVNIADSEKPKVGNTAEKKEMLKSSNSGKISKNNSSKVITQSSIAPQLPENVLTEPLLFSATKNDKSALTIQKKNEPPPAANEVIVENLLLGSQASKSAPSTSISNAAVKIGKISRRLSNTTMNFINNWVAPIISSSSSSSSTIASSTPPPVVKTMPSTPKRSNMTALSTGMSVVNNPLLLKYVNFTPNKYHTINNDVVVDDNYIPEHKKLKRSGSANRNNSSHIDFFLMNKNNPNKYYLV